MRRWKGAEDIDAILAEHGDSFKSRKSGAPDTEPGLYISFANDWYGAVNPI